MALIGKIRKNYWLLVLPVALALGGFIIMDAMSQSTRGSMGSQLLLGKVGKTKIDRMQFERIYGVLYSSGDPYQNRNALWNWYVEDAILQQEADALGIGVSNAEVVDLEFGPNPSPIIVQRFPDQNIPGTVNRDQLNMFKSLIENPQQLQQAISTGQLGASFPDFWKHQEKEIVKSRLQTKIANLVSKAMYTPNWMAEMLFAEQNQPVDFSYVKVGYGDIDNTDVTLEDKDYQSYIAENEAKLRKEEETRILKYVSFDVVPTPADSADLKKRIAELIPGLEQAAPSEDSSFVLRNKGVITGMYMKKDDLAGMTIADTVFKMSAGQVYGPYLDNGAYQAVKVRDRVMMADSADSRHILIQASTPAQFKTAEKRIDSLRNVLASGAASFDSLAIKFSQDQGSAAKGGKYENTAPNTFVPQYNRVLFITGEIGKIYKVKTDYGWHLIEVLRRSASKSERVDLAFLSEEIIPSRETENAVYQKATAFQSDNQSLDAMTKAAVAEGLRVETSPALEKVASTIGTLGSGEESREIVKWAFGAGVGDVSPKVYTYKDPAGFFDGKYVVAALSAIQKAGLPSVASAKEELEQAVITWKKGQMISANLKGKDLAAAASEYKVAIDTARNVNFVQGDIPNLGREPAVVGAAFHLQPNQTSGPVIGEGGVVLVQLLSKPEIPAATNLPLMRQLQNTSLRSQVNARLMTAIKKQEKIVDRRAMFY
ncbi:MAG: peptidylprolyl isomerase [Lewinellaceae bacterium]|nr:peptidylprolyl isomerase [Lewinellaceae bacterium]